MNEGEGLPQNINALSQIYIDKILFICRLNTKRASK